MKPSGYTSGLGAAVRVHESDAKRDGGRGNESSWVGLLTVVFEMSWVSMSYHPLHVLAGSSPTTSGGSQQVPHP